MMEERIEFFSGILLVSENPERLMTFYRDVVGIPLEPEEHDDTLSHYGCTLGDIHFAIHPVDDFPDRRSGVGAVKLAFTVFDIEATAQRLQAKGLQLFYPPRDTGFFWTTAVEDPDGNFIEFTQLRDEWFEALEERRTRGIDIIVSWRQAKQNYR